MTQLRSYDLRPVARVLRPYFWFARVLALLVTLGVSAELVANRLALPNNPTYLAEALIAVSISAYTLVFGFVIMRAPPTALTVDEGGLTYVFNSGREERTAWTTKTLRLSFSDARGTRRSPDKPGKPGYWVAALMPPMGLRKYPLSPEAFTGILDAAAAAGLRVTPPDWGPVVPGYWTIQITRTPEDQLSAPIRAGGGSG
jgi:hypothetical protein